MAQYKSLFGNNYIWNHLPLETFLSLEYMFSLWFAIGRLRVVLCRGLTTCTLQVGPIWKQISWYDIVNIHIWFLEYFIRYHFLIYQNFSISTWYFIILYSIVFALPDMKCHKYI